MFLALREFKHAKFRFLLISCIMILISLLVLFVTGLAKGLSFDNASSIESMKANYIVLQKDSDKRLSHSTLNNENLNEVQQYISEKNATPLGIQMTTIMKDGESKKIDASFFAIDTREFLQPKVIEGRMINNDTKSEVVVDASLKDDGIRLGDKIIDQISGKEFQVVGFTENQSFSHTPVIHLNFNEWSMIFSANQGFNAISLNTKSDHVKNLEEKIAGIEVIQKDEALKGIPGYKEEQGSLYMMIIFLFIIGAFVLAVFFYVITIQKINQFGVLKAIGSKTSYLAKNIVSQVLVLTVASLILSSLLTYGLSKILPNSMPFVYNLQLVLGCSLLFLVVALIGSLLSLYRITKIDAVEAIGRAN
ncbi:ABC transporter permease [Bacillus sp. OAE603]|uniref:ABC transporter permease n=1 Tax=Gottfriedia sp. OAE603 TaxID=2663872 RepID=UPI00178BD1F4